MIDFTQSAIDKMKEAVGQGGRDAGIRVAVEAGGCSGFQYAMKVEDKALEGDRVIHLDGLQVFVDEQSLLYLEGSKVDYESSWQGEGFRFSNPNSKGTCGCGESFSA